VPLAVGRAPRGRVNESLCYPSVAQLPDGSIKTDDRLIFVDTKESGGFGDCRSVDVSGARLLAHALIDAADEIDRWAAGRGGSDDEN
jgi:hypothetical protein